MNCEQADALINSSLDGEITREDDLGLQRHLASCAMCRESGTSLALQDARLRRAFAQRRDRAAVVADRVTSELVDAAPGPARGRTLLLTGLAAAAGFALAFCWPGPAPDHPARTGAIRIAGRVQSLLQQTCADPASPEHQQALRAMGSSCVDPLLKTLDMLDPQIDTCRRAMAGRLVADMAQPPHIPALIDLLGDPQPMVTQASQEALVRLTGWSPGMAVGAGPGMVGCVNTASEWRAWWQQNSVHFGHEPDTPPAP